MSCGLSDKQEESDKERPCVVVSLVLDFCPGIITLS